MDDKKKMILDKTNKIKKAEEFLNLKKYDMSDKDYKKASVLLQQNKKELNDLKNNVLRQDKNIVKGVKEVIDTKTPIANIKGTPKYTSSKLPSGGGWAKGAMEVAEEAAEKPSRLKALSKVLKKAGRATKGIPIVGSSVGLLAALASGDASAAVPVLGDVEGVGPEKGSPSAIIEDPTASPEDKKKAIEALRNKYRGQ